MIRGMNWLAILCAGAAYWVLGYVWYSLLFGKVWAASLREYRGERPASVGGMAGKMIVTFVANVVTAVGVAYLLHRAVVTDMTHALKMGAYVAIAFSIMTLTIAKVWEERPTKLWLIDASYHLLGCVMAAAILVSWP
jgi:Protein of unknown function (DUF1761)